MSDRFESLDSGEVVSIQHEAQVLSGHRTFRTGELNDAIKGFVANAIAGWSDEKNDWFSDRGIDCEALRFGSKGWQKGRIRVRLEFCADEPGEADLEASAGSVPTPAVNSPAAISTPAPVSTVEDRVMLERVISAEVPAETVVEPLAVGTPVAGIAATGAVAAVASMSIPELQTNGHQSIPHHTDTVLEPELQDINSSAPHSGGLDEIAFDFGDANNDRGRMIPNGMMELDLADSFDFSEHDLLSFEANGLSEAAEGFGSFRDLEESANSGMLMDEVWQETSQSNWPKIS